MRMNQWRSDLYKSFCEADGSQHIASEYAIEKINGLVSRFQIKKILEVGLGIGSISGIILKLNRHKLDLEYVGTEDNEFCLKVLPENLKGEYDRLQVFSNLNDTNSDKKFDLIIIDGKDQNLHQIKKLISKNGILVLEGDRIPQQDELRKFLPDHKYVHCISLRKNKDYSPFPVNNWQGGIKVIFPNPTFKQLFWWLKERYYTKLKYQFPGRYLGGENLIDQK